MSFVSEFNSLPLAALLQRSLTASTAAAGQSLTRTSVTLEDFTWVNTMIGNVKNAPLGTHHAINKKHLPRYLAESCYRFNRRFKLEDMLPRLGYTAVRTPPMPFRFLRMAEVHK